jgi:hypothetical protein
VPKRFPRRSPAKLKKSAERPPLGRRGKARFPAISGDMRHWSAMLEAEVKSWPGVSSKRMFGFHSLYHRKTIFAALPYSHGLLSPSSFILKFDPMPATLFQLAEKEPRLDTATRVSRKGWFSFELFSHADVRDAVWWLGQAYRAARKGKKR